MILSQILKYETGMNAEWVSAISFGKVRGNLMLNKSEAKHDISDDRLTELVIMLLLYKLHL